MTAPCLHFAIRAAIDAHLRAHPHATVAGAAAIDIVRICEALGRALGDYVVLAPAELHPFVLAKAFVTAAHACGHEATIGMEPVADPAPSAGLH